jgi:hypothetical protein
VITDDQVVTLFATANPVPTTDLLDPIESVDIDSLRNRSERSRAMSEVETTPAKPEVRGRRSRLVPVLAVVAIAVIALTVLLTRDDGVATPEALANAYMEARENLDAETAQALFAPDATVSDEGFDLSEMPALFDWYRASNWNWTPAECLISAGEVETTARCSYQFENDWTRSLEHAPVTGEIQIVVADGQITGLTSYLSTEQFGDVWISVLDWVTLNHPDDFDLMYIPGGTGPLIDDTSIALWERHTEEFVAQMEG